MPNFDKHTTIPNMATIASPRPQSPASSTRTPQLAQSPSLTPASSVRPSFDLPASARSSSPAPSAPAQRRNRAALRDYYNLKGKAAVPPPQNLSRTASITSTTSDGTITSTTTLTEDTSTLPAELDSPAFNGETYVASLLQTSNLKSILRTEASLISEIKNLDGERKALVYDNYSKLIAATQTIGKMQKSMKEGSVGSLERLRPAVEGIARMAENLDGRRASREVGKGEKRKKGLVRWVVDAPARFERYAREGRREDMEAEWEVVSNALDKWEGVTGVDEVRTKCEQVMKEKRGDAG
jgi:vacuolar protein sorting-associated protein 51